MPAAVAIPAVASVAGSAISSRGAKKAAKGQKGPQIPAQFQGPLGQALGAINQSLEGRGPGFGGPFVSEMMNQGGLTTALQTLTQGAQSAISQDDISTIRRTYAPLFQQQKSDLLAGIRQGQAARGTYFSSGALQQENLGLSNLINNQGSQLIPLLQQAQQSRLGAASAIPGLLLGGQQALGFPQMTGISALTGLMGGTPFYNPVAAPNAGMNIGGGLSNLAASPGFQAALRGKSNSTKTGKS